MDVSVESKTFVTLRDSDIVSEDNQNRLMFWRDQFRVGQFIIGDIVVETIESSVASKVRLPHTRIFEAVARFCGKKARTVRYYYEVATFYPFEVREEFHMLPFSHFVFARTLGGDKWRGVLEYAATKPHITADGLRVHFVGYKLASHPDLSQTPDDLDEGEFRGADDPENPQIKNTSVQNEDDETVHRGDCDSEGTGPENKTCVSTHIITKADKHEVLSMLDGMARDLAHFRQVLSSIKAVEYETMNESIHASQMLTKHIPEIAYAVNLC